MAFLLAFLLVVQVSFFQEVLPQEEEAMEVQEAPSKHTSSIISRVQAFRRASGEQNERIFRLSRRKRSVHMKLKYQCELIKTLHEDIENIKHKDVVVTYLGGYNAAGGALERERRCLKQLLQCQSSLLLPGYTGCLLLGLTPFRPYCV